MDQQDVFYMTPKRTLEEKVQGTAHAVLEHLLQYEAPVAAGVLIGVYGSEKEMGIGVLLGSLTALGSGLVHASHYVNDFRSVYPDYEGDSQLERQFVMRGVIGAARGIVQGGVVFCLGIWAGRYFEQVYNLVK